MKRSFHELVPTLSVLTIAFLSEPGFAVAGDKSLAP